MNPTRPVFSKINYIFSGLIHSIVIISLSLSLLLTPSPLKTVSAESTKAKEEPLKVVTSQQPYDHPVLDIEYSERYRELLDPHSLRELETREEKVYIAPSSEDLARTQAQVEAFDCNTVPFVQVSECEALVALYESTNGAGWYQNTNWLSTTNVESWYGVDFMADFSISLRLDYNNLTGSIPSELGNTSRFYRINLGGNQLSGSIPPELGNMSNIHELCLADNQLSGSIPPELGNLSTLNYLYLDRNQLSGSIPPELGNLSMLSNLDLGSNQLSGSIPPELGNLTYLFLDLGHNQLSGSIPPKLNSNWLYLDNNQLSGSIPPELGNQYSLLYINLNNNQLSGSIPPEIGNLRNLKVLNLFQNQLSGSIPQELGNLSKLTTLTLSSNQLSGSIPLSFIKLSVLDYLSFGNTSICEPDTPEFLVWKATVNSWRGTGIVCETSPIEISHIEINQGIQDEANSIPLIAGKDTLVSVFVTSDAEEDENTWISGTLRVYDAISNTELPFSPIQSGLKRVINDSWSDTYLYTNYDRLDHSLLFNLPGSEIRNYSNIRIEVEVADKKATRELEFLPESELKIKYIPISYDGNEASVDQIAHARSIIKSMYPYTDVYMEPGLSLDWSPPSWCELLITDDIVKRCRSGVLLTKLEKLFIEDDHNFDFYLGIFPKELEQIIGFAGKAKVPGGHVAIVHEDYLREGKTTMPHEIGHLLGQDHVPSDGDDCISGCTLSVCIPVGQDTNWQNLDCGIQKFGYDVPNRQFKSPNSFDDIMAYCDDRWVSDYFYMNLLNNNYATQLALVENYQVLSEDLGSALIISGAISTNDQVILDPVWYKDTFPFWDNPPAGTEYCVQTLDDLSVVQNEYCFDLEFLTPETLEPSEIDFFITHLPYSEGISRVAIRKGDLEIYSYQISSNTPDVQIVSPNGGESWGAAGSQTISWAGIDLDGDPLSYNVKYSPDGGVNWHTLALDLTATSLNIETADFSGSDSALIRVDVSDGFNTNGDVSDSTFTVVPKQPQASILAPETGRLLVYGEPVLLKGSAFDLEDGNLDTGNLCWSSTIDGDLGCGESRLASLSTGQHTIQLTAMDSDGQTGVAEVDITIEPCYILSESHLGYGTDPMVTPPSSSICPSGSYLEDEQLSLTNALPDPGWFISGWSGTNNDLSIESSNWLIMPAYDHTVAVNYSVIVPEVPVLASPDDAWSTDEETPTFTWSAANGADRYQIQISGLSAFTSTIQDVTLGSGILTYTADLLENGTYYWRVRGIGLADNPGDWSSARSFTIGNSPGAFTKTAPAESAAAVSLSPVLSWAESSGAASYQYCVDTTDDDDCSNWVENGADTSVQLTDLPENTAHYWQVKAINEFGTAYADAASTAFWSFTTGALPVAFSKTTPADNTTSVSIDPGISWEESVGADRYEYCIDTTDDNDCSTWVNNGTETSVTLTSLNSNTTYYWQVKAINSIGSVYANGDGAAFWTFTTRPGPVNFGKTSPADGEIGLSMSPGLFWQPSADATAYEYCYDTTDDDDCSSWVENGTETSTALADLAPNTTYYWQVRALDANGSTYGDHGDWWSFSTINFTPDIEQKLAASMVTFNWDDIPGATQYKLQLSLSSTFSTVIFTKTLTVSEFAYGTALTNGKTYYWRIQPYLNGAWGAWYPTWRFYSMNPPLAPSSTSLVPAAGAFFRVNGVDFSWGDVANDDHYQLQISETLDFAQPLVVDVTDLDRETRTYQATGLVDDLYYWHVRAIDEVGVPGAWSLTRSFTVDTDAPDAPGLRSPAADTSTYDTTPYLSVNAVLGAKKYRFKVVQGGNCDAEGVIPTSPDLLTTSWTVTPALPYSDDLYWCAQSIDAAGNESPWSESEARRLIITFQSLPKADASTADTTPTFSWYAVPGALGYDLIIEPATGEDNPATEGYVVSLGAVRSYTLPNIKALEPGGVYNWQLMVHTASGSQESPLRRLTIAPPAPVLTLPLNAKYVNTVTPTLEWNGVSGAAYYEIWVDTSTYFNTPNGQKWFTADAGTSYTPDETEALGETKYYWKVRAVNYDGTPGAFSAYRYFTVDSTYPDAPLLKLPAASAVVYGTPTFSWATAAGARSYRLEIDIDGGSFEEPIYERAGLTVLSHKPARVMFGVYNWRVWAVDAAGNETPSEVRRVFVFPLKPGGTTLISPPNAAFVNDMETPLELKWNTVPYADHYEILVDDSPLLTTPAYTHTVYFGGTSHTIPSGLLPDDTKYYWKVRAVNSDNPEVSGAWSAYRSFTVDRSDPEVPALVSPGDGETSPLGTPTFRWNASGGAKYYELVIDEVGGDFSDPVFYSRSKLTVLYHKPTVAMSGNYQWKVIATDLAGNSSESAPWTITVNPLKPGTPVLVSPVSGYMVNDEKVDFELTWKTVPYAATYNILVDDDPLFKSPVSGYPMSISGTSYKITDLLPLDNTKYYWKVQAVNSAGISLWSAYRYFTVDRTAPSAPPVLRLPAYGAYTYDTTPALSVNAVTGARWYCFQVARDEYFADVVVNPGCEVKSTSTGWSVPSVSALEYGQYWWRAQAIDAAGNITGWSDPARVFTVTFQRLPSHAFPTGDTTPTFSWYAVPGAGGYQLEVEPQDTDDNTATAAYSVYLGAVTSHTIPNIRALDPGEYQWRLRVYTAAGVKESPWRELVILPPAPVLTSPVNNAVVPLTFPMTWEAVPGAESYQIQLSTSSYFTNALLFDDIVENEEIITLTAAGKYYWRVRAKGCADAYGAWSAYRIITVTVTN